MNEKKIKMVDLSVKKSKRPIYCDFLQFTSIIWPCGRNNNFKFNNGGGLLSSVLLLFFRSQQVDYNLYILTY